ncbi:MAG: VanZ family protein [Gammaproteobacteria bacterium]|jgi:VanZ family protein
MNSNSPFELQLKLLWFGLAYCQLLAVAILSLTPAVPNIGGNDKLGHFVAYLALSISFSLIIQRRKSLWWILFGLVGFGLLMEYLQGLTSYRYADFADAIANSLGVVFGLVFHFSPLRHILQKLDARLHRLR